MEGGRRASGVVEGDGKASYFLLAPSAKEFPFRDAVIVASAFDLRLTFACLVGLGTAAPSMS